MPYQIKTGHIRLPDFGSLLEPALFAITAGERNKKSLLFHLKIGKHFHVCTINKINKNSVVLECTEKGCCARHKFKADPKFVLVIPGLGK
jgi:hypothetical protein